MPHRKTRCNEKTCGMDCAQAFLLFALYRKDELQLKHRQIGYQSLMGCLSKTVFQTHACNAHAVAAAANIFHVMLVIANNRRQVLIESVFGP